MNINTYDSIKTDIKAELGSVMVDIPEELEQLNMGIVPSEAGSYNQYFSVLVFVYADVRAMGTWIVPPAIMKMLDDPEYSLEHCKRLIEWILVPGAEFMDYCGLHKMCLFTKRIVACEFASKEELEDLMKVYFAYVNKLFMWIHHLFPWGLGTAFPIRTEDDVKRMSSFIANP